MVGVSLSLFLNRSVAHLDRFRRLSLSISSTLPMSTKQSNTSSSVLSNLPTRTSWTSSAQVCIAFLSPDLTLPLGPPIQNLFAFQSINFHLPDHFYSCCTRFSFYSLPGCFAITTVFSHAQTVVVCTSCTSVLCQPTGGKARLTEGPFDLPPRPKFITVVADLTPQNVYRLFIP